MTKNSFPIAYIKKTFRKNKEVWVVFGEMYSQKSTKNNFRVGSTESADESDTGYYCIDAVLQVRSRNQKYV